MPVKKSDDLLLIMSNLYSMKDGFLIMSPERMFQSTPLVKLGEQFQHVSYKKLSKLINNKTVID